jgi:hypothetical protein
LLLLLERPSAHYQKQPIQPSPCLTELVLELLELQSLQALRRLLELPSLRLLPYQKLLLLNL